MNPRALYALAVTTGTALIIIAAAVITSDPLLWPVLAAVVLVGCGFAAAYDRRTTHQADITRPPALSNPDATPTVALPGFATTALQLLSPPRAMSGRPAVAGAHRWPVNQRVVARIPVDKDTAAEEAAFKRAQDGLGDQ